MSKAAQGFLSEAYFKYVEGKNPRRTQSSGKRAIYLGELGGERRMTTRDSFRNSRLSEALFSFEASPLLITILHRRGQSVRSAFTVKGRSLMRGSDLAESLSV